MNESTENLLTAIYRMTRKAEQVGTKDLSLLLGLTHPTISEKVVKLAKEGLINYEYRKGVSLTDNGLSISLKILRKHRLIELLLVDVLKMPLDEVDRESCKLEHVFSDRVIDLIDSLLGFPDKDPHGHPIPSKDGNVPNEVNITLADALSGWEICVTQVSDQDQEKLRYLIDLGIVPGAVVSVKKTAPFKGPLTLSVKGKEIVIDYSMAKKIIIEKQNLAYGEKSYGTKME